MPKQSNEEKFRWQRKKREKSTEKIIDALSKAPAGRLTFTEILKRAKLSRPILTKHLKQMKKEGIIAQNPENYPGPYGDDKSYFITSDKNLSFKFFSQILESTYLKNKITIQDPANWLDKYGLNPFDEQDQQEIASHVADGIIDMFRFFILTILNLRKQNDESANTWFRIGFYEFLPQEIIHKIDNYLKGEIFIETSDGKNITHYYGDEIKPYKKKETSKLKQNNKKIKAEIERRQKLRNNYLTDAIRKKINQKNITYMEKALNEAVQKAKYMRFANTVGRNQDLSSNDITFFKREKGESLKKFKERIEKEMQTMLNKDVKKRLWKFYS